MSNDKVKASMAPFLAWGAYRAALLHLFLSLGLQAQNLWWTQKVAAAPGTMSQQAGGLLLFQWSSVLVALLVAAMVAALLRLGAARSSLAVSAAAGLLLIADAWAFRVLGDHLSVAFLPFAETPAFLTSSLLAEIDFLIPLDLLLLALGIAWQARGRTSLSGGGGYVGKRPLVLAGAVVAYLALDAVAFRFVAPPELSWHPIASLMRNLMTTRTPPPVAYDAAYDLETAVRPVFEQQPIDAAESARLASAAASVERTLRPNIVLVVFESTGARQLLHDGEIDPAVTPNLARLARHGVLFDQVYANIPGTAHANLAMSTGGRYPTAQSITDLMRYPYTGDILARRLKQKGYRTGLFASSDLGYLETRRFFAQAGYDVLSDFGQLSPDRQNELRLNSWGGRDDATAESAAVWLDQAGSADQPFFLHFMTNAPHHPFQIPPGFPKLLAGDDMHSRYLNALHYADAVLGTLVRKIEASGKADRTVFVITGDHGEAFNRVAWRNQGHRQGLYEEGIRTFLLVSSPAIPGALRSHRIGNHGDLLPTVAALTGDQPPMVPGQNLLGDRFQQRTAFFQFGHASGSWGLRDGRWKYISPRAGASPELYDLDSDPDERVNLADKEKERARRYDQLCSIWYFGRNAEFREFLSGYPIAATAVGPREARLGLEALTAGVLVPDGSRSFFAAARTANPADRIALETSWRPAQMERRIVYHWQSPAGKQIDSTQVLRPQVTQQRVFLPGEAPWPAGSWQLTVDVDGQRVGATQLEVTPDVRARAPAGYRWPELVSLHIGRDSAGHAMPVREIPVGEPVRFESEWNMSDQDRVLSYVLVAPSGGNTVETFTLAAHQFWHNVTLTPPRDVELGEWSLVVVYRDREIARRKFRIGAPSSSL
ncbi:MAG: sulfatase [Bacillota bacterium]